MAPGVFIYPQPCPALAQVKWRQHCAARCSPNRRTLRGSVVELIPICRDHKRHVGNHTVEDDQRTHRRSTESASPKTWAAAKSDAFSDPFGMRKSGQAGAKVVCSGFYGESIRERPGGPQG